MEDVFWAELKRIARARGAPISRVVAEIDANRDRSTLSSALRKFVLESRRQ